LLYIYIPFLISLVGSDIFLSSLFANICNLCSFLTVTKHVLHPCKRTCKRFFLSKSLAFWKAHRMIMSQLIKNNCCEMSDITNSTSNNSFTTLYEKLQDPYLSAQKNEINEYLPGMIVL
jgi:hypothetical protein